MTPRPRALLLLAALAACDPEKNPDRAETVMGLDADHRYRVEQGSGSGELVF